MNAAPQYPPLTIEQQRLVVDNQRFAFKVAWEQRRCGMPFPDVQQAALLGLIYAAQRFDGEAHGTKFTTFSAWWIRACIWRAAADERHLVRLTTTQAKRRIVPRVCQLLRQGQELKDIDPAGLAEVLDVPVEEVEEVLLRLRARASDVRVDAGAGASHVLRAEADAEERASARQLHRALARAIDRMATDNPRLALILRERFLREEPATLQVIADQLQLTKERVRQLEVKALERVRREFRA